MRQNRIRWIALGEVDALTNAHEEAWQSLKKAWGGADSFKALPPVVAYKRTKDADAVGWQTQLPADYLGVSRTLEIILPGDFPIDAPLCWVEPNPYLEWPHGEVDGKLCLWPPDRKHVGLDPAAWIEATIDRLGQLFELVAAGSDAVARGDAFAAEWTSYWSDPAHPATRASAPVLLVTPPTVEPTLMAVYTAVSEEIAVTGTATKSKSLIVCGDDESYVETWLNRLRCPRMLTQL